MHEAEASLTHRNIYLIEKKWTVEGGDYDGETLVLPCNLDSEVTEKFTIVNTMPTIVGFSHIGIFNHANALNVYIDNELRYSFSPSKLDSVGLDWPALWVYFPIYPNDSGKEIVIDFFPSATENVHYIGEIAVGDMFSLAIHSLKTSQVEIALALSMLLLSLVVGISCIVTEKALKLELSLKYMTIAVFNVSLWIVLNSVARQFIMPNVSIARDCAFMMVSVLPIAFCLYMDSLQQRRYHHAYRIIEMLCMTNAIVSIVLHLNKIIGLSSGFYISAALIIASVILVICTLIMDFRQKTTKNYKLSATGVLVLGFCAIFQLYLYKTNQTFVSGSSVLSFGMLMLMVFSTADAIVSLSKVHSERAVAVEQIRKMSLGTMEAMAKTVDSKSPYTADHSAKVAAYAVALARKINLPEDEIESIHYAALLHDIGKLGTPDTVLNKPGKLTDAEESVFRNHAKLGSDILKNIDSLDMAAEVALHHHERYDGLGYPDGLKGDEIPLYARIVAIADNFDSMTSNINYQFEDENTSVPVELLKGRGTKFDPILLDNFLELYTDGTLASIDKDYTREMTETTTGELLSTFLNTVAESKQTEDIDFLTGVLTRQAGEPKIVNALLETDGYLAFIDLDNLKHINDTHGHTSGDNVIKLIGETLAELGTDGITCRLGGDEFLYFMPQFNRAKAEQKAKKILTEFDRRKKKDESLEEAFLSMGLTKTSAGEFFQDVYERADHALYYRKKNGKAGYFFAEDFDQ
ncbi:MAG: diguanylate cyclase [Lachnospiraceae bacterium]|nr:diguanylate cyclase [Lachnospiraceae bacterium]